jgi:hypothetical protein
MLEVGNLYSEEVYLAYSSRDLRGWHLEMPGEDLMVVDSTIVVGAPAER